MQRFKLVHLAVATLLASALIAGCSGGSKSSLPPAQSQAAAGKTVGVTLSFMIGSATQSAARNAKYVPQNTESIVIKYQGDTAAAPPIPGGANPPSTAVTAATVNVTTTPLSPPPPGECTPVGTQLQCTVTASIPVGVLDLYILAYSGLNGTGTLLASSVTTAQVNPNGSLTQPGTTTPATLNALVQNIAVFGSTVSFVNANVAITPGLTMPNPVATPTAIPSGSWAAGQQTAGTPFSYSPGQGIALTGADGSPVAAGQPIASVTLTDTDTSGATCLAVEKYGASAATPCPFTSAGRTATLTNSSDMYAVLYNNKFVPGTGFTITATFPNASVTPSPQPVTITPAIVAAGGPSVCCGQGALVWDPIGSMMYQSWHTHSGPAGSIPLASMAYSSATGYGTPATIPVTSVNGSPATSLTSDTLGLVIGPEGNMWMTEYTCCGPDVYIAGYVINALDVAPIAGNPVVTPGAGHFVEYHLIDAGGYQDHVTITSYGGYIWVVDETNAIWRIDPSSGTVYPNLGTPYNTPAGINPAYPVTTAAGVPFTQGNGYYMRTNLIVLNGKLYIGEEGNRRLFQITPDTSATPSNKCTGGTTACIATAVVSTNPAPASPATVYTDGTSIYMGFQNNGTLVQYSQSLLETIASAAFTDTGFIEGLAQGADGWFWEATSANPNGGASWIPSLAAAASGVTPNPPAACNSSGTAAHYTGNVFLPGPDKTLIMGIDFGTTPFCAVIY